MLDGIKRKLPRSLQSWEGAVAVGVVVTVVVVGLSATAAVKFTEAANWVTEKFGGAS